MIKQVVCISKNVAKSMIKLVLVFLVTLLPLQVVAQCSSGYVYLVGFCCTPELSVCLNPNTGEVISFPSYGSEYGSYNYDDPSYGGEYGRYNYGGRNWAPNPNRFECLENCKNNCPEFNPRSPTLSGLCRQRCVYRCYR